MSDLEKAADEFTDKQGNPTTAVEMDEESEDEQLIQNKQDETPDPRRKQ
jgi:hypothetical protein